MMYVAMFQDLTPIQLLFIAIGTALVGVAIITIKVFILDDLVEKLINKIFK